jgi:hypothetical protein
MVMTRLNGINLEVPRNPGPPSLAKSATTVVSDLVDLTNGRVSSRRFNGTTSLDGADGEEAQG